MTNLSDLLLQAVERSPGTVAFSPLKDGEAPVHGLTYEQLGHRSLDLGRRLADRFEPGARIGLINRQLLDFVVAFFACQHAGLTAVPLPVPDRRGRNVAALQSFVLDAGGAAILTDTAALPRLADGGHALQILTESALPEAKGSARLPGLDARDNALAYLQYTSGSTSTPKGVVVTQANALANLDQIAERLGLEHGLDVVSWLPWHHDQGLVGSLLLTVHRSGTCHCMTPAAFIQRPLRWLQAISAHRAHLSGGPNFAYDLCVQAARRTGIPPDIDLRSWAVAFNGAEPVRTRTLEDFCATFRSVGFSRSSMFPCYGLAEATLAVTMPRPESGREWRVRDVAGRPVIGCGPPMRGTSIRVTDPATGAGLAEGEIGDVWIAGPSVTGGYWGQEARNESAFARWPVAGTDAMQFLRTGDVGLLCEGEVYILARRDEMFVVRGRNRYPIDIAATTARCDDRIRPSDIAVLPVGDGATIRLAVELDRVTTRSLDLPVLAQRMRETVADEHGILVREVHFVSRGELPRTSSGKVQRARVEQLVASHALPTIRTDHPQERGDRGEESDPLCARLLEMLQSLDLATTPQHAADPLVLDSLDALRLVHAVETQFQVDLDVASADSWTTVDALSRAIAAAAPTREPQPSHAGDRLDVNELQLELLLAERVGPPGYQPVVGCAVHLDHRPDESRLREALASLVAREPRLNARISGIDGGRATFIPRDSPLRIELIDETGVSGTRAVEEWHARRMEVATGPLLRVALHRRAADASLLLQAHHLVCDHRSMHLIAANLLSPTTGGVAYAPFERWLAARLAATAAACERYWTRALEGAGDVESLDRLPRRHLGSGSIATAAVTLDDAEAGQLRQRASSARMGVNAFVLACFAVVAARLARSEDVVIACPVSLRMRGALADAIGYCVNTVLVRARVPGSASFGEVSTGVHYALAGARRHAEYPLTRAIHACKLPRADVIHPLCRLMFNVIDDRESVSIPSARGVDLQPQHPLTELQLTLARAGEAMALRLSSFEERYDAHFLEALLASLRVVLRSAAATPQRRIRDMPLVPADHVPPRAPALAKADRLDELFALTAARSPSSVALKWRTGDAGWEELGYGPLMDRVTRAAAMLSSCRGGVVGVMMQRSPARITALLAVMRAGAAYLPLDPSAPADRLRAMVTAARCTLVVTDAELAARAAGVAPIWTWSQDGPCLPRTSATDASNPVAALIFTSGSTGIPKGVAVPHRAYLHRLAAMQAELRITSSDVFVHKTPLTFDVSVWEVFLPLVVGACLVLPDEREIRDAQALADLFAGAGVTITHFVPSLLANWLGQHNPRPSVTALRLCLCSGEALTANHRDAFRQRYPRVALVNLYGPTECGIDVTMSTSLDGEGNPPIGFPTFGSRIEVLGDDLEPLPRGALGQIAVGGPQLALGYAGQPDATAARFVPDPAGGGDRLYLTGDLGWWGSDGQLRFMGRIDRQVKLHGVRVELEEIATWLRTWPNVREAHVLLVEGRDGPQIVAAATGGDPPAPAAVRSFLARWLPPSMIPSVIQWRTAFPLLPNGKADRAALAAEMAAMVAARDTSPSVAGIPVDARIRSAWSSVLGCDVSDDDNFFAVGGDSIHAIRLVASLRRAGLDLSLGDVYRSPTPRQQQEVASQRGACAPPQEYTPFSLIDAQVRARLGPDVEDAYPLSALQKGLVFASDADPRYEVYISHLTLEGRYDEQALRETLAAVLASHPFLRSSIDLTLGDEPMQVIHAAVNAPLEIHDWRGRDPAGVARSLELWRERERSRRFDWSVAPLVRFAVHRTGETAFVLHMTETALDGWCVASLLRQIAIDLDCRLTGSPPPSIDPGPAYARFVALERAAVEGLHARRHLNALVADARPPTFLRWRSATLSPGMERCVLDLPEHVATGLAAAALAGHVSQKTLLLAAHAAFIAALTGARNVIAPVEMNGRLDVDGGDRTIGAFNNIVPRAVDVAGRDWRSIARDLHEQEVAVMPYRRYPFSQLLRDWGGRHLADALFVYTDFRVLEAVHGLRALKATHISASDQTYFPLCFHVNRSHTDGRLRLLLDYDTRQFDALQARFFAKSWVSMVEQVSDDLDASCGPPIEDLRRRSLARYWTFVGGSLLDRVAASVEDVGSLAAVSHHGGTTSYADLWRMAARCCAAFRAHGCKAGSVVAVVAEPGPMLLAIVLGAWRIGAAVVLTDPEEPPARIAWKIADSGASIAVVEPFAWLDDEWERLAAARVMRPATALATPPDEGPLPLLHPAQCAYILHTSGSTGQPKAVAVSHGALANYTTFSTRHYGMRRGDRVWSHSSPSFDFTITTLLVPLAAGACVDVVARGDMREVLSRARVDDVLKLTPAHVAALRETLRDAPPGAYACVPARLILGGATLHGKDVEFLLRQQRTARVFNEYGPTETTVGVSVCECQDVPADEECPIGEPIDRTQLHVLDDELNPVAPETSGHLHIGGASVADGYAGDPALTALRFVPDPFGLVPGGRLHRSGDIARRRADGRLVVLGRVDRQVKRFGYRIDLSEVEKVLCTVSGIAAAAADLRDNRLLAWAVSERPVDPATVESQLSRMLPWYMKPEKIVFRQSLPLSPNGKVDRSKLVADEQDPAARTLDEDLLAYVAGLSEADASQLLLRMTRETSS